MKERTIVTVPAIKREEMMKRIYDLTRGEGEDLGGVFESFGSYYIEKTGEILIARRRKDYNNHSGIDSLSLVDFYEESGIPFAVIEEVQLNRNEKIKSDKVILSFDVKLLLVKEKDLIYMDKLWSPPPNLAKTIEAKKEMAEERIAYILSLASLETPKRRLEETVKI